MRKNDKALFVAFMAFMLAFFCYFNSKTVEGLVPGFEKSMQSNWKIQNRSEGNDDITFNFKNDSKFVFKPDGTFECKDIKITGKLDCNNIESKQGLFTKTGKVLCGSIIAKNKSKISNWRIQPDRIGVQGKMDLAMGNDQWLRLLDYDKSTYAGTRGRGGFASFNLWTDAAKRGKIYAVGYAGPGTPLLPHAGHHLGDKHAISKHNYHRHSLF